MNEQQRAEAAKMLWKMVTLAQNNLYLFLSTDANRYDLKPTLNDPKMFSWQFWLTQQDHQCFIFSKIVRMSLQEVTYTEDSDSHWQSLWLASPPLLPDSSDSSEGILPM